MSKATEQKSAKAAAVRTLTPKELEEIREMSRIAAHERFRVHLLKENLGNAMLKVSDKKGFMGGLSRRDEMIAEQEVMAELAENANTVHIRQKMREVGCEQGKEYSLNLETGVFISQ